MGIMLHETTHGCGEHAVLVDSHGVPIAQFVHVPVPPETLPVLGPMLGDESAAAGVVFNARRVDTELTGRNVDGLGGVLAVRPAVEPVVALTECGDWEKSAGSRRALLGGSWAYSLPGSGGARIALRLDTGESFGIWSGICSDAFVIG